MKNKNKSMYSIRNKKKAKHPFIILGVNKINLKRWRLRIEVDIEII